MDEHLSDAEIPNKLNEILGLTGTQLKQLKSWEILGPLQRMYRELSQQTQDTRKLVNQKEYVFLTIFKNLTHISRLYGSCGSMYAVEYAEPLSNLFPEFFQSNTGWERKARIALSLLDLLLEFKNADFGPLSICDMKPSDFGVKNGDKVVLIDHDMVFTKSVLDDYLSQPNCKTNKDCDFFDCKSQCDAKTKKCSSKMMTNNLQVMCQKILWPPWPERGILHGLPAALTKNLMPYLAKCVSEEFGTFSVYSKPVSKLLYEIRSQLTLVIE